MKTQHRFLHTHPPVLDFTRTLLRYGADLKYLPRVLIYYIKFGFFEPFRLLDRVYMRLFHRKFRLSRDPVFILGYYRSGTTHLQETLIQDPRFGHMDFYQCYFQNGFLTSAPVFRKIFNIIIQATGFRHPAHNIPFHFDLPGEEDVSMVSSGYRLACSWGQVYPRSFKEIFGKTAFYIGCSPREQALFEYELGDLVKRVAIANRNKWLLLKSPPHTGRVAALKRLYPNAKFIFIHRNPHELFRSNLKLWDSFNGQCLQRLDQDHARECILWSFDETLERYQREKKLLGAGELVEVSYDELQKSPLQVFERIYAELGIEGFEEVRPRFEAYLSKTHGSNIDQYEYEDKDLQLVESRWKKWLELWGYGRPSPSTN